MHWEYNGWFSELFGSEVADLIGDEPLDSEAVVDVFKCGNCHSLAFAIQDLTGLPVLWIENGQGQVHCANEVGENVVLDIEGVHAIDDLWSDEEWTEWNIRVIERDEMEEQCEKDEAFQLRVEDAMPWAKRVLAYHEIETKEMQHA